jgi:aminopeptidase S
MAAPHASGVVALLWSAAPALQGDINATRAVLDQTARDVNATGCGGTTANNNIFGEGRIDALAAVEEATGGGGGGEVVFEDDFETANGWVTDFDGSDTATSGEWERGNPQGTSFGGTTLQLNNTTSGSNDLVTGAAAGGSAGVDDIDNGDTTIRSPAISLPAGASLELEFNYYFAHLNNATSADYLRVTVVGPGGSTTVFQQLGAATNRAGSWSSASVNLSGFAGQTVRLLVEAADAGGGSLIEAGIDDVTITAS